jgi:hypothetical protein
MLQYNKNSDGIYLFRKAQGLVPEEFTKYIRLSKYSSELLALVENPATNKHRYANKYTRGLAKKNSKHTNLP